MSKIEWTDKTWNPIAGCSIVSPGCTNCYAMKMAARIEAMRAGSWRKMLTPDTPIPSGLYTGLTQPSKAGPVWTGKIARASDETLTEPLRRKKPTMYFVNSMSDLFHEDVPDEWIDQVFAVMAITPQHTYQVLTKRAARMRKYVDQTCPLYSRMTRNAVELAAERIKPNTAGPFAPKYSFAWPLPNVWLGVSAERQQEADARIPDLLATPAAVRFVSAEPLLGPIDFQADLRRYLDRGLSSRPSAIDWIIVGGESGAGARPMHPDWARSIRDQCADAGVAFFFKQWGRFEPTDLLPQLVPINCRGTFVRSDGAVANGPRYDGAIFMRDVGKKSAGRLLYDREHNEMPSAATKTSEAA